MNPDLVVSVGELRRRLGSRLDVHCVATFDDLALRDGGSAPPGTPVSLDAVLESIFEGVVVTGTVTSPWEGPCRRCLTTVSGTLAAEVREVFALHPVEGETYALVGDQVDLEPLVREAVLLSLPLAPLCDESCEGPAPEAFPARIEDVDPDAGVDEDAEAEPAGDPRWAALDELRFDR